MIDAKTQTNADKFVCAYYGFTSAQNLNRSQRRRGQVSPRNLRGELPLSAIKKNPFLDIHRKAYRRRHDCLHLSALNGLAP